MKKLPPKDNINKLGRTPTTKNNLNNISLMNKRGASSDEKAKKSLFKNFLEFKKSNPYLDKNHNKASKTDHEQSKENHTNCISNYILATATTNSLNHNLNNSVGNINSFELIEKIFRFIKPKIPSELYNEFKGFINEEYSKIESGSYSCNLNSSFSSINEILNIGASRNVQILDESTITNTISKNTLSTKLNVKLMNNLSKNPLIKKLANNSISKVPSEDKNKRKQQIDIKSSLYCDYKSLGNSKLCGNKELMINNNSHGKIQVNNAKNKLKKKSKEHKSLNNSAQKSGLKEHIKIPKNPKLVNEISINLNDLMNDKNEIKTKPSTSKASLTSNSKIKLTEQKSFNQNNCVLNVEMVNAIKSKVDDDLKHLFNFSYDNFHSKENDDSMVSNRESFNY